MGGTIHSLHAIDEVVYQENDDDVNSEDIDEGHHWNKMGGNKVSQSQYQL